MIVYAHIYIRVMTIPRSDYAGLNSGERFRDLTEARSRRLLCGHVYACQYTYISTHIQKVARSDGRTDGRAGGRAGAQARIALVRSSNEESSRVPARRSARSVSTRLAIGQYRTRE